MIWKKTSWKYGCLPKLIQFERAWNSGPKTACFKETAYGGFILDILLVPIEVNSKSREGLPSGKLT